MHRGIEIAQNLERLGHCIPQEFPWDFAEESPTPASDDPGEFIRAMYPPKATVCVSDGRGYGEWREAEEWASRPRSELRSHCSYAARCDRENAERWWFAVLDFRKPPFWAHELTLEGSLAICNWLRACSFSLRAIVWVGLEPGRIQAWFDHDGQPLWSEQPEQNSFLGIDPAFLKDATLAAMLPGQHTVSGVASELLWLDANHK